MSLTPHEEESYLTEDTLLVFEYFGLDLYFYKLLVSISSFEYFLFHAKVVCLINTSKTGSRVLGVEK